MQKNVIIVAGGSGQRMGTDIPKQFLALAGKPILMHTIEKFYNFDPTATIIVVLPANQFKYWQRLCETHQFKIRHELTAGGEERFFSVKNGLDKVVYGSLVAIHDGVRPLVSDDTLFRCFDTAAKKGSAIPVVDTVESVREIRNGGSCTVDRNRYKMVQTPQVFIAADIIAAYNQRFNSLFTDDASVFEAAGKQVNLVAGNRENIKVTTPMDIVVAEALLK